MSKCKHEHKGFMYKNIQCMAKGCNYKISYKNYALEITDTYIELEAEHESTLNLMKLDHADLAHKDEVIRWLCELGVWLMESKYPGRTPYASIEDDLAYLEDISWMGDTEAIKQALKYVLNTLEGDTGE